MSDSPCIIFTLNASVGYTQQATKNICLKHAYTLNFISSTTPCYCYYNYKYTTTTIIIIIIYVILLIIIHVTKF